MNRQDQIRKAQKLVATLGHASPTQAVARLAEAANLYRAANLTGLAGWCDRTMRQIVASN